MSVSTLAPVVLEGLSVAYRDRVVLSGVDLVAAPGRRIGLVGENGSGKSTLLRAVAGTLPSRARVGGAVSAPAEPVLLRQEPAFRDRDTVAEVLARTLAPLRHAVAEVERLAACLDEDGPDADGQAAAYAAALERAIAHDAWGADRRAAIAAERLGLADLAGHRRVGSLSGGQRTRLVVASVMTTRPECLLLDEPTNHLDDAAVEVLTDFVLGLPGVVLVASHDRVLLDDVCTDLLDLDPGEFGTDGAGGRRFGGGWTAYEEHRQGARRRWEQAHADQQEQLKRLRAAIRIDTSDVAHGRAPRDNDRFISGFKGANVERTLARRKRDAARRLAQAEQDQVRKPRPPLRLRAPLTAPGGRGRLVVTRDLVVTGRLTLERLDVTAGEHLLVSGANGSGKSTLLGVLSGRVGPTSGTVQVGARRIAELVQDVVFDAPRHSARATYAAAVGDQRAEAMPLHELGLLPSDALGTPVGLLSVGQRRRLGLAIALAAGPDLLLLDEPTNHISLALAGELEEALGAAAGTVVVASHDRWLRRRWSGAELVLTSAGPRIRSASG